MATATRASSPMSVDTQSQDNMIDTQPQDDEMIDIEPQDEVIGAGDHQVPFAFDK